MPVQRIEMCPKLPRPFPGWEFLLLPYEDMPEAQVCMLGSARLGRLALGKGLVSSLGLFQAQETLADEV